MDKIELNNKERDIVQEMLIYYSNFKNHKASKESNEKLKGWLKNIANVELEYLEETANLLMENPKNNNIYGREQIIETCLIFDRYKGASNFKAIRNTSPKKYILCINENEFDIFNEISDKPNIDCLIVLHGLFHELQHLKQGFIAEHKISSHSALVFAKEQLLIDFYRKFYSKHHNVFQFEEDANFEATTKLSELIENQLAFGMYSSSLYKIGNREYQRNDFINAMFDRLIQKIENKSEILNTFQILSKEYNPDFTRKSSKELLLNMQEELNIISNTDNMDSYRKNELKVQCKYMYYELLYKAMQKSTPSEINELKSLYVNEHNVPLFKSMNRYFKHQLYNETEYVETNFIFNSEEEMQKEIDLRKNYYGKRIDFINQFVEREHEDIER